GRDPTVCRLRPAHPGPLHPQGSGPPLAQQVPQVQRLPHAAGRALLQPRREPLLQGRLLQALRDQVRRVPAGHPAHAGGAPRPGLRVPPALLRLRRVQAAAGHGRRVLPHGGQPARVQGRLRDRQAARGRGHGQAAAHDHHGQAAGDAEERLQHVAQARAPRARAALLRDRPGHARRAGQRPAAPEGSPPPIGPQTRGRSPTPAPQVWFQNRRAKEKRLKKDAGRQRWGQYFRNMKRARGGSKSDKDSVQEEGQDSDAEVSFTDEPSMAEMGPANGLYGGLGEPAPALGRPSGAPGSFPLEHGGLAGPEQYGELRPSSPYGVPSSPAALQSLPGPQPLLSSLVYPEAGLGLVPAGAPGGPPPMRVLAGNGPSSDLSTGSSGGYPDFPASPASWLDEVDHAQF
uniref:LIM homeobox 3 n=1 Tax=Sus scrofa TaxID=9823 RepID=A0A8D1E6L8_PIG